ncbi:MAG: hypothetical protein K0Q94_5006 [Paenibacillus sp.]|jgi:hypothetical protein|nr:hypothetical protein [Paenibacillus sp.]
MMSVIIYVQSGRMLENEIHEANDSLLQQFREAMDSLFDNMKRLSFELSWNVMVGALKG